jgi:hypothetical protein
MARKDRRGRDRMVVGFTITYASIAYHHLTKLMSELLVKAKKGGGTYEQNETP